MIEYPSIALSIAAFSVVKPNRCHGVKSTKLANSMTEKVWVSIERLQRALAVAASILQVPLLAARAVRARRKAQVRRWLESPSGGAMLFRTQRICWARVRVASLLSIVFYLSKLQQ
ncbi:hypothetical protein V6N13_146203 [Hibiscus sabdariffa]|uniref:Uncharacterized protein n=1 Tax=Hibiscus sabdariffa TaxID=183260 RepID=A0ABR2TS96_9ROSI